MTISDARPVLHPVRECDAGAFFRFFTLCHATGAPNILITLSAKIACPLSPLFCILLSTGRPCGAPLFPPPTTNGIAVQKESDLRVELIDICRKLAAKGLIAATDGNVSCRVGEDRLLITPSGTAKGDLRAVDLLLADLDGQVVAGATRPSSEIRMHLLAYRMRPDVRAVVHAHPPMLTAFTLAGVPFTAEALPEVWLTIGRTPTAPYATPSTDEVPDSIAGLVQDHQAILLERHGSLTFGNSLREAYLRLEKLEHAAHTLFFARLLAGRPASPLPGPALEKLARAFGRKN